MGQRITVVDAFTHEAFAGNPAAVCVLTEPTTEAWIMPIRRRYSLQSGRNGLVCDIMTSPQKLDLDWQIFLENLQMFTILVKIFNALFIFFHVEENGTKRRRPCPA